MALQDNTPLINGFLYSHASIRLRCAGLLITRLKEINYKQSAPPGKSYGTSVQKQGSTRGKLDGSTSLTIIRQEYNRLITVLNNLPGFPPNSGYMYKPFELTVEWRENPSDPILVDEIVGPFIFDEDFQNGNETSSDAATVKLMLDIKGVKPLGIAPIAGFIG